MKRWVIFILGLLVAVLFQGASSINSYRSASVAPTYLLSDGFEYANNAAMSAAGWNLEVSPVAGYITPPAPLQGTYSFNLPTASDAADRSFTATGDVWAFDAINTSALSGSGPYPLVLRDAGHNNVCLIQIQSGFFTLQVGTANTSGGSISTNTTYYFWLHYVKGTGANAIGEVYYSTTPTRPGSPTLTLNNGNSTTDAANVQLYSGQTSAAIFDYIRVSATSIGSAPP